MKYTRQFTFVGACLEVFPQARILSPDFNKIAKFLNDKYWQIDTINLKQEYSRENKKVDILELICNKYIDHEPVEEETYTYLLTQYPELAQDK